MQELMNMLPLLAKVALVVLAVNAVLSGAKVALDKLQALFPSSDEVAKADSVVGSVLGVLSKVADFLSANLPH